MFFYNTPFHLINDLARVPFNSNVYVVSDARYKELQQKQAAEEIAVLENRAAHYERAADRIRETIVDLQKEAGLLPEASDTPATPQELPN